MSQYGVTMSWHWSVTIESTYNGNRQTLKQNCCYFFNEIFITDCTIICHFDNYCIDGSMQERHNSITNALELIFLALTHQHDAISRHQWQLNPAIELRSRTQRCLCQVKFYIILFYHTYQPNMYVRLRASYGMNDINSLIPERCSCISKYVHAL